MTEKTFKYMILVSIGSAVMGGAAGLLLEPQLPAEYLAYIDAQAELPITLAETALAILLVPFLVVTVWATVGLYQFKKRQRTVSLWLTALSLPLYALTSPVVVTGLEDMLMCLSNLLWGGVLAAAYFSPLQEKFNQPGSESHSKSDHVG